MFIKCIISRGNTDSCGFSHCFNFLYKTNASVLKLCQLHVDTRLWKTLCCWGDVQFCPSLSSSFRNYLFFYILLMQFHMYTFCTLARTTAVQRTHFPQGVPRAVTQIFAETSVQFWANPCDNCGAKSDCTPCLVATLYLARRMSEYEDRSCPRKAFF